MVDFRRYNEHLKRQEDIKRQERRIQVLAIIVGIVSAATLALLAGR